MEYNFREIEQKWQSRWATAGTYKTQIDKSKPKYYVLDMFPYPSGAGLHVGHPLGYIASDIYSRYKRLKGFNVLHPMGYDAFGLPAEQYAIQTGQHPAVTTEKNIARYREQLDKIGFSYDWDREVRTSDPAYYHWTQWVFMQLFGHWFDNSQQKARPLSALIQIFEQSGNIGLDAANNHDVEFTSETWKGFAPAEKENILLNYRLAYMADTMVNWCPALGTVLANDEVKEGFSVRGGHPVEQHKMKQWLLRVSAYAKRLLDDLETLEWTDSLKEIQRNWIGRSEGAQLIFEVEGRQGLSIFTTRPDTLFGSTFMVIAPESDILMDYVAPEYREAVENYRAEIKKRTERERIADTHKITGQFLGTWAKHPFTGEKIPIWTSEYVLAGYGTGAIMAVPAHDARDYAFARHFGLPVKEVVSGGNIEIESYDAKDGIMVNSQFLNGLNVKQAILRMNDEIEKLGLGSRKVNYRLRDAIFSRQRYWGEPFPVFFDESGNPQLLPETELPLCLPDVDAFLPTESGEPPLGRASEWKKYQGQFDRELSTMPGFAGSSAYYLRYMDPKNPNELVSKEANEYWQDVDLYIGGTEHATGHLIYSRFWNKFLYDIGLVCKNEPFRKLINQGMIQGRSNFVYRVKNSNRFVSLQKKDDFETTAIHVDVNIVQNDYLDIDAFRKWNPEYEAAEFILDEEGRYRCGWAVEKMSKSMFNVVNPDDIVEKYGADTLRLYEMFLGPLEQSKPWDTNGIEGVYKFLRKFWRLFHNRENEFVLSNDAASSEELKVLHQTIKKIEYDIIHFSFNTSVSTFMIAVNSFAELKCNKREVLEPMLVLLSSFAPHICEELWEQCGYKSSITQVNFPIFDEKYLIEDVFEYPVSFNGKLRFKITLPIDMDIKSIENEVLASAEAQKWLQGNPPKKMVVVPKRIINVVI